MRAIEARGISRSFGKARVLSGLDLWVEPGEALCLLGKNGAGKTTLIRILTTLLKPDAGEASLFGVDVLRNPRLAREKFSLTGQSAAVDDLLTGRENLILMARLRKRPRPKAAADELLARFGLEGAAGKRAGAYSGGMRRRLDLAMGLVGGPPLLFLDEPTTGLDPESRIALWGEVKALGAAGTTVLLTTQHLEEADMLAHRVAVLAGGKIAAMGTARALKEQYGRGGVEAEFRDEAACRAAAERLLGFGAAAAGTRLSVATEGDAASTGEVLHLLAGEGLLSFDTRRATLEEAYLNILAREGGNP